MSKLIKRVSILIVIICVMTALTSPAKALTMDTRTLAMVNKPGVVLIQTIWTADVTWYEISFQSNFWDELGEMINYYIEEGYITDSDQDIYSTMIWLMATYMSDYAFFTGNYSTEQMSTGAIGTGFIVTPDGYLVTNAHVVATDEEELTMGFAMTGLEQYAIQFADGFDAELRREGYFMTEDEWYSLANAYYGLLSYSMEINNLQTSYYCYMGNVTPGSDVSIKGKGLDLRKMGEPIPGKDIAILKLDGNNFPTVTIGDDTKLRTGDQVYAMGYPGVATIFDMLDVTQAAQEPTLTQGIISARKEMAGGWSVLQTDADIHGGNSGGPLFNAAGEVIGINTFTAIDESGMTRASGMNFAIPISLAMQFLHEINVTPAESDFTRRYKEAISLFQEEKYGESADILRGLNETNPGFPVVAELLAEARTLADSQPSPEPPPSTTPTPKPETSETPETSEDAQARPTGKTPAVADAPKSEFPIIPVAIGGGAVVVIAVIVLVLVSAKKKKKAQTQYTAYPSQQGYPPQQHGYMHQPPVQQSYFQPNQPAVTQQNAPPVSPPPAFAPVVQPEPVTIVAAFCPQCGAPLEPGKKFCAECGARIAETETVSNPWQ